MFCSLTNNKASGREECQEDKQGMSQHHWLLKKGMRSQRTFRERLKACLSLPCEAAVLIIVIYTVVLQRQRHEPGMFPRGEFIIILLTPPVTFPPVPPCPRTSGSINI